MSPMEGTRIHVYLAKSWESVLLNKKKGARVKFSGTLDGYGDDAARDILVIAKGNTEDVF